MADRGVKYKVELDLSDAQKQLRRFESQVNKTQRKIAATQAQMTRMGLAPRGVPGLTSAAMLGATPGAAGGAAVSRKAAGAMRNMWQTAGFQAKQNQKIAEQNKQMAERVNQARRRNAAAIERLAKQNSRMATSRLGGLAGRLGMGAAAMGAGGIRAAAPAAGVMGGMARAGMLGGQGIMAASRTLANAVSGLGRFMTSFRTLLAGYLGQRTLASVSNAASSFEDMTIQLQKLGDSYRRQGIAIPGGEQLAKQVYREAVATPFEAKDILEGVRTMMAFQIYEPREQRSLKAAQDLAATFGKRMEEVTELFGRLSTGEAVGLALRSLARFGVLRSDITRKDPRIQFGARGELQPRPDLVRQFGPAGAREMAGKQLLQAVVGVIEDQYKGMTQERMKTFRTQMQNLKDAFDVAMIPAGKVMNEFLTPAIKDFSNWLTKMSPQFRTMMEEFTGSLSEFSQIIPFLKDKATREFEKGPAGTVAQLEQDIEELRTGTRTGKGAGGLATQMGGDLGRGILTQLGAAKTLLTEGPAAASLYKQRKWQENLGTYSMEQLKKMVAQREGAGGHMGLDRIYIQNELNKRVTDIRRMEAQLPALREAEKKQTQVFQAGYEKVRDVPGALPFQLSAEEAKGMGQRGMDLRYEQRRDLAKRTRDYEKKYGRPPPIAFGSTRQQAAEYFMGSGVYNQFANQDKQRYKNQARRTVQQQRRQRQPRGRPQGPPRHITINQNGVPWNQGIQQVKGAFFR